MTWPELMERARDLADTGAARVAAGGVALACLALAVYMAIGSPSSTQRAASDIRAKGVKALYVCKACGKTGETRKGFDEPLPPTCPHCGKPQAVAAFRCVRCGRIIEAVDASLFHCPHCRHPYDQRLLSPQAGTP